jgi:helix-turn-helix protein
MNQPDRRTWREGELTAIGAIIARNIELATTDPIARGGFTQVPNFILENSALSLGAKVTYALFLHFAWNKDSVFPGQDRLAAHMGMSTSRANEYIKELEAAGLIEITRRGQGKTNIYKLHFVVKQRQRLGRKS